MALTGVNLGQVRNAIAKVMGDSNSVVSAMHSATSTFVEPMSQAWASEQAVEFFKAYKEVADNIIKETVKVCKSVMDSMDSAASNWAALNGASYSKVNGNILEKEVDVSSIKNNIGGTRGIDVNVATDLAKQQLGAIRERIAGYFDDVVGVLNANTGFLDDNNQQTSALVSSVTSIGENIGNALLNLENQANTKINETVEAHGTFVSSVSSAFSGK